MCYVQHEQFSICVGHYWSIFCCPTIKLQMKWNFLGFCAKLLGSLQSWDVRFLGFSLGNHVADVLAKHRAKHLVSFVRGFIYLWIVSCVALIILMYEDRFTFLNYHTIIRLFYQTLYREFYISCKGFSSYFVITISVEWNDCFILKKKNKELC